MSSVLLLALVVACATLAAAFVWQQRRDAARREALFTFATLRGWDFTVSEDALAGRWTGTPFGRGERRKVSNVMRGTAHGRPLVAFDYSFVVTEGSGKGSQKSTRNYSVVVLGMPGHLPVLEVVPESVLDRVGSAVGMARDLDLESEDFNRKYRVVTRDPRFGTDVLTPRTMHALVTRPALAFRIQGLDVVSWEEGQLEPLEVVERASTLDVVIDGIPSFVWRDRL